MTVLLDTSFLLAATMKRDQNHQQAAAALRTIEGDQWVAAPVVVELFFMVSTRLTYGQAIQTLTALRSPRFQIVTLTQDDRERMLNLMNQYQDAELDFADTAQIAIAERLNIHTIYTFDRRDFSMVRPAHSDYFDLKP